MNLNPRAPCWIACVVGDRKAAARYVFVFSGSVGLTQLLERHKLTALLNDTHEFRLNPFALADAIAMIGTLVQRKGLTAEPTWSSALCERVGWLSPFYLNLLLSNSLEAAKQRDATTTQLSVVDIDTGLKSISRGTFHHWCSRLQEHLPPAEFSAAKIILSHAARNVQGVSRRVLMNRLQTVEPDAERRAAQLDDLLLMLEFEGYLDIESDPVCFLSPLLRTYWKTHHAHC